MHRTRPLLRRHVIRSHAKNLALQKGMCKRRAIHLASRGLQVMPRSASDPAGGPLGAGHLLTGREAEVLPLLQQGRSNAQIALALQVGVETVRTHARNIYRKLGVSSRRQLAATSLPERKQESSAPGRPPLRRASMPVSSRRGHGLRHR